MTPVPLAPREVGGLLNLRGHIITAIDLRRCLTCDARANGPCAILRTADGGRACWSSHGTCSTSPTTIRAAAANAERPIARVDPGRLKLDGRLLLVDIDRRPGSAAAVEPGGRRLHTESSLHQRAEGVLAVQGCRVRWKTRHDAQSRERRIHICPTETSRDKADIHDHRQETHFGFGSIIAIIVILFIVNRVVVVPRARRQPARLGRARERAESRGGPVEDHADSPGAERLPPHGRCAPADEAERGDGKPGRAVRPGEAKAPTEFLRDVLSRIDVSSGTGPRSSRARWSRRGSAWIGATPPWRSCRCCSRRQDPTSWNDASAAVRDEANAAIRKTLDESMAAAARGGRSARAVGTRRHDPGDRALPRDCLPHRHARSSGRCGRPWPCCGTSPKARAT